MFFADKLPVDYYTDFETGEVFYFNLPGAEIFMGVAIAVAVIALAVYLLLWFLSKKSFVPLIVAEVLVVFDTLGLVVIAWLFGASSFLMDFVFHVVIMVFLGLAIYSGVKAKKLERLEKENGCATEEVQDGEVVLEVVPEAEATEVLEKTEE